jgi:hypothetical protein
MKKMKEKIFIFFALAFVFGMINFIYAENTCSLNDNSCITNASLSIQEKEDSGYSGNNFLRLLPLIVVLVVVYIISWLVFRREKGIWNMINHKKLWNFDWKNLIRGLKTHSVENSLE